MRRRAAVVRSLCVWAGGASLRVGTMKYGVALVRVLGSACLVPALVFGSALLAGTPAASARQAFSFSTMGDGPGGGAFRPPVTTRDLDRYAQVLGLSAEQKETVKSMIEGVVADFNAAAKEAREKMAEVEAEFQETRDPAVFRDRMPETMKRMGEKRGELEKTFLGDLKLMLTPEQEGNWTRFERLRRREGNVGGGRMFGIAGESVDLIKIGEKVGVIDGPLLGKAPAGLKGLFEQYETELDGALQAKARAQANRPARKEGEPIDMEAMQAAMAEAREKSLALRDINQKYARQIGSEIGDPLSAKWNDEVKRATFPEVYRETYAEKALKSAFEMDDLTSEQKSVLQEVREQLDREMSGANEALARAIQEADTEGARGGMTGAGGQQIIRFGAEPEGVKAARAARREVENRAMDKVNSTLNEGQKKKLPPKRTPRQQMPAGEQEGDVHMEIVVDEAVVPASVR